MKKDRRKSSAKKDGTSRKQSAIKRKRNDDTNLLDITREEEASANAMPQDSIDKRDTIKLRNEDLLNCMVSDYDVVSRRSHGVGGPRLMSRTQSKLLVVNNQDA